MRAAKIGTVEVSTGQLGSVEADIPQFCFAEFRVA
jgi:hypothetical protein